MKSPQPNATVIDIPAEPTLPNPFFSTDHLEQNLARRSVRGAAVTFTEQATTFVLGLACTAILARLLRPEDYGLMGMVGIVVGFVSLFRDAGLSMATIQQKTINREQVSTLFWLNVSLGCTLAVVLAVLAPGIAWFYERPELTAITLVTSTTFALGGLTAQHSALLQRQMRFGTQAAIRLTSLIVGMAVGITAAWRGCGYWALMFSSIASSLVSLVGVWLACPWIPGRPMRGVGVLRMLKFGGNLMTADVFIFFFRKFDDFLVSWKLGAGPLAIYQKAYTMLLMPIQQINGPISAVAVPALSRLQDSPEQFRRYYQHGISLSVAIGMPMVVGCFCATDELVLLLLGHQWVESIAVFRALAIAAFVGTFNVATGWVVIPLGRSDRQLVAAAFSTVICVIGMIIGLHWGIIGVAVSVSITNTLVRLPQFIYCFRGTPIRLWDLFAALWPPAFASLFAGLVVWLVMFAFHWPASILASLFLKAAIYVTFYAASLAILPAGRGILRQFMNLRSYLYVSNAS